MAAAAEEVIPRPMVSFLLLGYLASTVIPKLSFQEEETATRMVEVVAVIVWEEEVS